MELVRCQYCTEWALYEDLLVVEDRAEWGPIHPRCYREWARDELEAADERLLRYAR